MILLAGQIFNATSSVWQKQYVGGACFFWGEGGGIFNLIFEIYGSSTAQQEMHSLFVSSFHGIHQSLLNSVHQTPSFAKHFCSVFSVFDFHCFSSSKERTKDRNKGAPKKLRVPKLSPNKFGGRKNSFFFLIWQEEKKDNWRIHLKIERNQDKRERVKGWLCGVSACNGFNVMVCGLVWLIGETNSVQFNKNGTDAHHWKFKKVWYACATASCCIVWRSVHVLVVIS